MGYPGGSVSWVSDFSSGDDLTVCEFEPCIGLCADSLEPGACFKFYVSLSLCSSPTHALSFSLLQEWIKTLKKQKNIMKYFLFPLLKIFIYFWERERERDRVQLGEGQRERKTQNPKQALSCQHRAWCGTQTHKPQDHDLSWSWTLNWLSHSGAPKVHFKNFKFLLFIANIWEYNRFFVLTLNNAALLNSQ